MSMTRTLFILFHLLINASSTFPLRLLYANHEDIRLLWTNRTKSDERVVVSEVEGAVAVDFLYEDQSIFWTDVSEQKIFGCSLKTICAPQVIVSGNLGRSEGLAVDWITRKLYWTDYDLKQICVSTVDGKYRNALIWSNLDNPRAIAVDPRAGFMFWSDWGETPRISRAGMDGSNKTDIVTTLITWPNGLTLDYQENKVYWLDARHNYIATVDYYGNSRHMTYTQAVNHPYALTMLDNQLYWTDWDTSSIRNCLILSKNITYTAHVIKTNLYSPMDIKVYEIERQPNASLINPCARENGGCSHLCLLAPAGRHSCACSSGVALMSDMKTCEDGPQTFLLLGERSEIRILSLSTEEYRDLQLPIKNIGHLISVVFDPVAKAVCWIDSQFHEINCAPLNGSEARTIVRDNVSSAEGLSIDWISRSVFWTDTESDCIEMSHLNGTSRKVIVSEDLDEPRAIVVDPKQRFVYWSDWGVEPKLERARLDGTDREILINTSIAWPNGLVLDHQERKLYWADAKLDKIEVCDMTGSNRVVITRVGVPHIFGLTMVGNYLYWTDLRSKILARMHKTGSRKREIIMDFVSNAMSVNGVDLQVKYDL